MSDIKMCFSSRFRNGLILEADFSQLEVVGLAVLSGDPVLKDDILSGRDMHRQRAADLFSKPVSEVTDDERQLAKRLSFQLQYGAGAASMAAKNGIEKELAELFIFQYYNRYKGVKEWQEHVRQSVEDSRVPTGERTPAGYPKGKGTYMSPTGRMYTFFEYDAPAWARNKEPRFSPTEMKNYPCQGFATADLMALYRGRVYRRLIREDMIKWALPINTVHDSVMFDVDASHPARLRDLVRVLEEEAENLPQALHDLWGINCDLPFKIEYKAGPSWGSMKKLS